MRLQGAIFDMDGTLVDSMGMWAAVWPAVLRELGAHPAEDIAGTVNALSPPESADYCKKAYGLQESREELIARTNGRAARFYASQVQIKPDADKLLSILKMQGVWMYVATATDRPLVEAALRHTGLDGYFRGILTATEAGAGKDDPRIFEKCLTRLRCRREACMVFEDSLVAVRTAKAAGFPTAGVYDPFFEADQPALRAEADVYIRSFGEFLTRGEL